MKKVCRFNEIFENSLGSQDSGNCFLALLNEVLVRSNVVERGIIHLISQVIRSHLHSCSTFFDMHHWRNSRHVVWKIIYYLIKTQGNAKLNSDDTQKPFCLLCSPHKKVN